MAQQDATAVDQGASSRLGTQTRSPGAEFFREFIFKTGRGVNNLTKKKNHHMKVPWYLVPQGNSSPYNTPRGSSTMDLTGLGKMRWQCFAQNPQQEGILKTTTADYGVKQTNKRNLP